MAKSGIGATRLAVAAGVTERTAWRWKAGARPEPDKIVLLARAFGVAPVTLAREHYPELFRRA